MILPPVSRLGGRRRVGGCRCAVGVWATAVAVIGEAVDQREFPVDGLGKGKGVETLPERLQRRDGGRIGVRRGGQAVEGRWGGIVPPGESGAAPDLPDEFHGGLKQVHHEAELVAVEVVDGGDGLGGVVAVPAHELADASKFVARYAQCPLSCTGARG